MRFGAGHGGRAGTVDGEGRVRSELDGWLADGCMHVGSWVDEARSAGCRLGMNRLR